MLTIIIDILSYILLISLALFVIIIGIFGAYAGWCIESNEIITKGEGKHNEL